MILIAIFFLFIFQDDDFVLVELNVMGKKSEEVVHYVGKVLSVADDQLEVDFLRMKSLTIKDTFYFPTIKDVDWVGRSKVLGVLSVTKGSTQRHQDIIKIFPPLTHFNMR